MLSGVGMQYKAWSIPLPYSVPAAAATPYTIESDALNALKRETAGKAGRGHQVRPRFWRV